MRIHFHNDPHTGAYFRYPSNAVTSYNARRGLWAALWGLVRRLVGRR